MKRKVSKKSWAGIPPWVVIGAVLILAPIFVFLTFDSINLQKENTIELLKEKGAALIRSFEAGARTGMMGMRWGGAQVQRLLSETARQPDISYILITDVEGKILADSDLANIGKQYGAGLNLERISHSKEVAWRRVSARDGSNIFEVFRQFSPIRGGLREHYPGMMRNDWCRGHVSREGAQDGAGQIIFVGLDMGPVEVATREGIRRSIVMAVTLLLIGFAGIVSLFLAQAYRTTRTSLSRVKAFSDHLVHNMPIGLLAIDTDERIASFNQTAESVLELSSVTAIGKRPTEILPLPLSTFYVQLKTGQGLIDKELDCPVSGGRTIPLEVVGTVLEDEDSVSMGWVILFRDLTEIRYLKKEIARSQRLASIGRLAAGVAHEIRNPLSSIKGFATYFKERYREIPEDQKTAEIMIQEVERLNRVIGQLLEFARPMSIQKRPVSLSDEISASLKMVEGDAQGKGININFKRDPGKGDVWIDPDRIKQVLLNLYLNAIEAMGSGGTLSVELVQDDASGRLQIRVSDTGTGIKDEDLPHLFDPYFTTKPSGTGLGLAIVHNIIESHGGEVSVESRYGEGTTVTIRLPSDKGDSTG
ncbi:MAG: PAS domain-containing protein [Desulfobacterales bacterium]|nr:PAS domain-containing protein [Desulfobacterales bacterium]MBL7101723.1 PAS domain-containing protein [Desulfobacteraceae bacterium]MBL7172895.1 PAS domain-containing protein [Desulfobacteraceae bacterium]